MKIPASVLPLVLAILSTGCEPDTQRARRETDRAEAERATQKTLEDFAPKNVGRWQLWSGQTGPIFKIDSHTGRTWVYSHDTSDNAAWREMKDLPPPKP